EAEIERVLKTFVAEDRGMIDEIAAVWDPDLPPDEGVREVFYSGVTAAGYALGALGHDEAEIERVLKTFVAEDRGMIDEIAAVWDPDLPP
ncbi:hypothetical protein CNY89_28010, partial [Amaricoccus sp. HAR-UPW-R2A-40]